MRFHKNHFRRGRNNSRCTSGCSTCSRNMCMNISIRDTSSRSAVSVVVVSRMSRCTTPEKSLAVE